MSKDQVCMSEKHCEQALATIAGRITRQVQEPVPIDSEAARLILESWLRQAENHTQ